MEDHTSERKESLFPVTRWTVVQRMSDGRQAVKLQAWSDFSETYWPALVMWLEHRGVRAPDAQDLVQGLLKKLWSSDDFAFRLSPEQGKLRSFLLKALRNWQKDWLIRETCLKRGGQEIHIELDDSISSGDDDLYDQEWARATLRRACLALRARYLALGNQDFFDHALRFVESREPADTREMKVKFKMTENAINVGLKRLRERLANSLRAEVTATLVTPTPAQVDDEIRHLLSAFGKSSSFTDLARSLSHSD